jgi:hypothetical protein
MKDFTLEMKEILELKRMKTVHLFRKNTLKIKQDNFPDSIYNFIEYYINEFSVENKD